MVVVGVDGRYDKSYKGDGLCAPGSKITDSGDALTLL